VVFASGALCAELTIQSVPEDQFDARAEISLSSASIRSLQVRFFTTLFGNSFIH
jgi:hypothetical protein